MLECWPVAALCPFQDIGNLFHLRGIQLKRNKHKKTTIAMYHHCHAVPIESETSSHTCSFMHCKLTCRLCQKSNSTLGNGCKPSRRGCAESLLKISRIWWDQSMMIVSMECNNELSTAPERLKNHKGKHDDMQKVSNRVAKRTTKGTWNWSQNGI